MNKLISVKWKYVEVCGSMWTKNISDNVGYIRILSDKPRVISGLEFQQK
jgi:hypothetical protein